MEEKNKAAVDTDDAAVPLLGRLSPTPPSIGRVVHYKLRTADVMKINELALAGLLPKNNHEEGQVLPAVIVRVWNQDGSLNAGSCNLKVLVDGAVPDLWVTSATRGDAAGQWNWPPRV